MNRHKQLSENDQIVIAKALAKVETNEDFRSDKNWPTALSLIDSARYKFAIIEKDDFSLTDELPAKQCVYIDVKQEVEKLKAQGVDLNPDLEYVGIFTGLNSGGSNLNEIKPNLGGSLVERRRIGFLKSESLG